MLADSLLACEALHTCSTHVIGPDLIKEIGTLGDVVSHRTDDCEHQRRDKDMLTEVYEPFERVVACVGGQPGHVKKGMASPRIDIDEEKDKEEIDKLTRELIEIQRTAY